MALMRRAFAPPVLVALYLAPLVLVQAWAHVEQWALGFRPFAEPAHRVSFSWDMFAGRVERCVMRWDPPLVIGGRVLSSYDAMRPPVEWDVVWDNVADYEVAARSLACEHHSTAELTCFVGASRGLELHRRVSCAP